MAEGTLVEVKPYKAEREIPSDMTRIYFVGYKMYAAQKGRVGVILSKQKPYAYPELGDFLEVPRTVAADIESKSRWNGNPTMVMREHGGEETAKLVRKHFQSASKEAGIDKAEFRNQPAFADDETHEEYQRRVEIWQTQRDRALDRFYNILGKAEIASVYIEEAKTKMSDEDVLALAIARGLIPAPKSEENTPEGGAKEVTPVPPGTGKGKKKEEDS